MKISPKTKAHKPHPFDIFLGNRVRVARVQAGESQDKLAKRWGVTFQQVQKYEKGINRLTHHKIYEAAHFYKLPMAFFTEGYSPTLSPEDLADLLMFEEDMPTSRGAMRVAQLYNELKDENLQKAVIAFLNSIVLSKRGKHG